jgi:DNA modification methylase
MQIHHGDCLEVLRAMPDASVDAIVTDPPYGLSFMGKRWDYDVPSEEIWRECLRVLKPGGHLLAFAGTRTQHRMAVRIEDAGFEIRDMIAWVYSTGFPKSHNFGCKCSRDALPYSHEENLPREPKAERDLHPLRDANVSTPKDISEGRGEVLQPCLSQSRASIKGREQLSAAEIRKGKSIMEGRRDLLAKEGQLQANQIRPVSGGVPADGEERRIHHGASLDNGADNWKVPDADRSGASCKSQYAGQQTGESGAFSKQRSAQERGMASDKTCQKCGKLIQWHGWGTALKPALEPITVARKPLVGTVAANVLEHGTGAINVDGCRISGEAYSSGGKNKSIAFGRSLEKQERCDGSQGRWPANLIHDGSDEVVGLFPQSGGGHWSYKQAKDGGIYKHGLKDMEDAGTDKTTGSAARFFYCAKASKKDRDEGLLGWTEEKIDSGYGGGLGGARPHTREDYKYEGRRKNNHPTVKPTDLMRYLCRLVTPPGGTVLDPFMGSGSTGKAAVLEGFNFIGIEREAEYVEIAKARIAAAQAERGEMLPLEVEAA